MTASPPPAEPLRLLLVGPSPPPHGGISVHLSTARLLLRNSGVACRVLDSGGHRARGGAATRAVSVAATAVSVARLMARIDAHARRGFTVHLHTNGHGVASWCVALACGVAARRGRGRVLTLHSGLLPDFLDRDAAGRWLQRVTLAHYEHVVCVNQRMHDALVAHGAQRERLSILPAHLVTPPGAQALPESVERWIASRSPIVSSALFFRPEFGFEVLLEAIGRLTERHPRLGCVVMGGDQGMDDARRRIAELGLDQRMLVTGDLPHSTCLALMARSDVFARPALTDGDAISVREALAIGVPVVASDASERPPGTTLHRTGDASDLAAHLDAVLSAASASEPSRQERREAGSGLDALLRIYRQARGGESSGPAARGRLVSRAARLREMSAREVAGRLGHAVRARADRLTPLAAREESHRSFLEGCGAASGSFERHLQNVVAPRFYLAARPSDRRSIAELLWHSFPSWLSAAAGEAERLCEHRVELLGHGEVELGADIDWHRDPVSGAVWPRRHFASYDPVRERGADPKRIHELNRHQHLPRLGKAYFLLGEERYAREVVEQMLGWIEQNPRGIGIHWHSSLEIAIRALSWMWALFYVLPAKALDEAAALRIGKSLHAQLDHVAAYPSTYTSPNTHLLGEATALFVGGLVFQGPRGRRWLELGRAILDREATHQVLDDGMHAELSPYYHCYAIDFYLQALTLARRSNQPLDPRVWERVERMLDALLHVAGPGLAVPLLGDDDGGRALALGSTTHYRDAGDLLCAGAVLFGRGDWKRQAGAFREEALWLVGREAWAAWEALPAAEPRGTRVTYPDAGYVVERAGWSRSSAHLVFDRGGLGKLGGGHGHADALQIVASAFGQDLLVDSGTGVYNAAPEWRTYFRSTRAHNTVAIDGAEQSSQADTFRWTRQATTRALGEGSYPGIHYAAGEHDGYASSLGLVHRRRVLSVETGYWLVLDDVSAAPRDGAHPTRAGSARRQIEVLWHFAPEAELALGSDGGAGAGTGALQAIARVGTAGLLLQMHASGQLDARVVRGATAPLQGWVSRRYGEKRPAPVLEARFRARAPAVCMTILAPWSDGQRARVAAGARAVPVRVIGSADDGAAAVAVAIPHARGEDLVVLASRGALVEAGPCRARAEALWLRLEEDRPAFLLALDASSVELCSERVLASASPVDHFWSASARAREGRAAVPHLVEEPLRVRHRRDR